MPLLRASSRPRATAELGYRLFAGVLVGGFVELLGVNLARDRNPQCPDYLIPSLVAAGAGLLTAILDPPVSGDAWIAPDGTVIDASYGHAQAALGIVGPLDEATVAAGVEADYRCRGWDKPEMCVARHMVERQGYVRVLQNSSPVGDFNVELFRPLTAAQRAVLYQSVGGPNIGKPLTIDTTNPATGALGRIFEAPAGSISARHHAIDAASEAA